jgi:hypothetical protein
MHSTTGDDVPLCKHNNHVGVHRGLEHALDAVREGEHARVWGNSREVLA